MRRWSVGVRSMLSGLKHGRYKSLEDIDTAIREAEQELTEAREYMRIEYIKRAACIHTYNPATYSIQRRIIGFVRVNERVCKNCKSLETQTENEDGTNRPEWAKNATEAYYNNDI